MAHRPWMTLSDAAARPLVGPGVAGDAADVREAGAGANLLWDGGFLLRP